MNLTKKEAVRLHRIMWDRISKLDLSSINIRDTTALKMKVLNEMISDGFITSNDLIFNSCFCCEYSVNIGRMYHRLCVELCPIQWLDNLGIKHRCYEMSFGLFSKFRNALCLGYFDVASKIAKQISELPERPDEDFDIL